MAKVGPQRAAELTGVSKSTIQRAMKGGKISYEIDNAGRRVIDVSELERVFGLAPQGAAAPIATASIENELEKAASMIEAERMKMRIRMLEDQMEVARDQIEDLKEQRDQWQKQAQQVLITSQYSQKQAEELKEELKERDRRAQQMRRQAELRQAEMKQGQMNQVPMNQKGSPRRPAAAPVSGQVAEQVARPVKSPEGEAPVPTEKRRIGPFGRQKQVAVEAAAQTVQAARSFDIQGLWQKIRGESVANSSEAPVADKDQQASA
jgi:hypothetical protein